MNRKGFGLIELLIVIALVAVLAGGGFYVKNIQSQQSAVQTGLNAEKQAKQAVQQMNRQTQQEQGSLDRASAVATTTATGTHP
jgi:prepilin-type N-terminal cleavage/methylation domain-containing protein